MLRVTHLIKFFFVIFLFLNSIIFADDNKIIFKVNNNIYSTVDFKNRIKYLEILNSSNFESDMKIELINDYYSSVIFYEYVKNNNFLNNILETESANLYDKIIVDNNQIINHLNIDIIKENIKYDFSRKSAIIINVFSGS